MRGGNGITVPYGAIFDGVRKNFLALPMCRGAARCGRSNHRGRRMKALHDLLVCIAGKDVYFSLGCHLGCHPEPEFAAAQRQVAGGYIQFAAINYSNATTAQYDGLCKAMMPELRKRVGSCHWRIEIVGTWVEFCLPNEPTTTSPSMWTACSSQRRARRRRP